jgi:hypothetical protein
LLSLRKDCAFLQPDHDLGDGEGEKDFKCLGGELKVVNSLFKFIVF